MERDNASTYPSLTRSAVQEAHQRIRQHIHLTPVLTCSTLDEIASTPQAPEALKGTPYEGQRPSNPKIRLFFKCENLQRIGAFKTRGAFHALSRLSVKEKRNGVITNSSGTFAQTPLRY